MRYDIPPEDIQEQIKREEAQREAALGRRFNSAQSGFLGPVISRWINASIAPVAQRVRHASTCYLKGDYHTFGKLLDTPTFGLAAAYDGGSPEYLNPILAWCVKGTSPGRIGEAVTFAEDLTLAILGRTISDLAMRSLVSHGKHQVDGIAGLSLAMTLSSAAACSRETALGQFITMCQGAQAMGAIRRPDRSSWAQRKRMSKIAGVLSSQVRHALESEAKGEISLEHFGARTIIKVLDPTITEENQTRRLSIKAGDLGEDDWKLLSLASFPKGEDDAAKNAWISFAMMVLCAAQVEHGWFDLTKAHTPKQSRSRKNTGRTRYLVLADKPRHHLKQDLAKWISLGFAFDPMIVPPPDGTYLTFKTRAVTGRNGPHGWKTIGEDTTAWELAGDVMAATPWQVAKDTLDAIQNGSALMDLAQAVVPDELARRLIVGSYAKEAIHENIYMPLYMDFRGRIYTRTSWVSYQGNDLQKGLLKFPPGSGTPNEAALALHVSSLMGFDKVALPERLRMLRNINPGRDILSTIGGNVEEPIQLWTAIDLIGRGMADSVPIQMDGTCNGLQHLSAMFRDEAAAPWVNLSPASHNEAPSDLYAEVAKIASEEMDMLAKLGTAWAQRLQTSGAKITRSVCKKPVMVLPYGGTIIAIEEGITDGILAQEGINATVWHQCLKTNGVLDPEAIAGGYLAFSDRPLNEHPLFKRDMQKLGQVVHQAIKRVIPRAMEAMDAFRQIAGKVGDRSLEWSNSVGESPLWIVHAYPKSERRTSIFRGFHLPNSVRGLAMKCGRDEVNPQMHRTGIVANFIHSQDAAHLVETMAMLPNGVPFGANHDCLYTRSSFAETVGIAVRGAFAKRYLQDPLRSPVRLRSSGEDAKVETFESWYALAKHFGIAFPEMGRWDPSEVMKSAWFFS